MSVAIPIPLLQHLPDVNVTPAVGVDEYALTYDHDTARFVLRAPAAPFAGILATGATVGATAQAQAFTFGVVSPFLAPAADSTTAVQVRKADKTTSVLNVDTTNGRVGIGTASPAAKLHVISLSGGATSGIKLEQLAENTGDVAASYAPIDFAIPTSGIIGQFLVTANNYVGVNKNLPASSLAIWAEATSGTLSLAAGGASGDIRLNTGGYAIANERLRITSTGLVGINDTAPAEKLDVTGNINTTGVIKVDDVQVLSNRVIDARCADVANSGDATTDGLIDALRDAMIAHGLIAASA